SLFCKERCFLAWCSGVIRRRLCRLCGSVSGFPVRPSLAECWYDPLWQEENDQQKEQAVQNEVPAVLTVLQGEVLLGRFQNQGTKNWAGESTEATQKGH